MRLTTQICLIALPVLAACATPQEQCIADASRSYKQTLEAMSVAQGNIARGYAVHVQSVPYEDHDICYDKDKRPYSCTTTRYRTVETPVAIDVKAEREKLAQFSAQLPALQRNADALIAQCKVLHPE